MAQEIIIQNADNELSKQFGEVVSLIRTNRNKVYQYANTQLIETYWAVGKYLSERLASAQWGDGVVKQLADYITKNEPGIKGFSRENLHRMRKFYDLYAGNEIVSPLVTQIGWTNNLLILSRCKSAEEREFYIRLAIRDRLSKRELDRQIDSLLFERCMLGNTNLSPLAKQISKKDSSLLRDSYVLEFITGKEAKPENELRKALIRNMKDFILELGKDFIYMGEEYRVQVGMSDFRIDLLFFHRELQCLVAFEIKTRKFKPGDLGQLEFYLEALDRDVKKQNENPSIGVLLCTDKDDEVVEYALARSMYPTMVAHYQLNLPDKKLLQQKLRELYDENENIENDETSND